MATRFAAARESRLYRKKRAKKNEGRKTGAMGKRLSGKKWVLKQKKRRAEKERKKKITFLEKKGEEKKTDSLLIFNINLRFGTWYSILSFRKKGRYEKIFLKKNVQKKGA